jgi:carboxymethylenebutenolidase
MEHMGLHTEWITYGDDNQFTGYLARPVKLTGSLPAIIVAQEIWGVEKHIQEVTQRFAQAGYVAIAPDLFAVRGAKPEHMKDERVAAVKSFLDSLPQSSWGHAEQRQEALDKFPEAERQQLTETLQGVFGAMQNVPAYLTHLQATSAFLRNSYTHSQGRKIGIVGFCLGGHLSLSLAATDPELAASVIFYGRGLPEEQLTGIQCPVIGFYGGKDPGVTDGVPALTEALKRLGKSFEPYIYEDAPHAFFNDSRSSYRPDASRDAFVKTLSFFNQQLV